MQQPTIRTGTLFFQLCIFLTGFLLFIVLLLPKAASFELANFYHNRILDVFFIGYTYLGDGAIAIVIVVMALLRGQKKLSACLFLSFIISGIAAQVLKNLFHAPRPATFFNHSYHHFIAGVTNSGFHSFPSGHTTTAFAIAATLACHLKRKMTCTVFFILALGVGYSRVYLGQHFVEDVLAGMVLGVSTALLVQYLHPHIKVPKFKTYSVVIKHEQPAIEL